jgi:hypothetical protein
MKFEKSNVQTVVSTENVTVGMKGYLANQLDELSEMVELDKKTKVVERISNDGYHDKDGKVYSLFYPVYEGENKDVINDILSALVSDEKKAELAKKAASFTKEVKANLENIRDLFDKNKELVYLFDISFVGGLRSVRQQDITAFIGDKDEVRANLKKIIKDYKDV